MSTQLDAFAHRRLAQSSKTLVALLVYPPSSVGFVLKQLQNCLFDFRGVRNVRSHIVCVSASEAEGKNAKKERDVKVLLLSEEILTPASVQSVKPLCEMKEEFNDGAKTAENITFVSLEELLTNADNVKKNNLKDNIHFPPVLRDRLCHGLTDVNINNNSNKNKHNVEKNTKYMNTEFALATSTVHLTYVNYTMPELLKMVIEHYQCEYSRNSLPSTNNNGSHSVACNDEETNHNNTNTVKSNIAILSGFEQVGHIAHVNLAESHLPFALCIGQVILDCNPNIHVVVNKVESIATTFREFKMDVIALRFGAIHSLLHEYVHAHAKYGTNVEFVDLHTQVDRVKQYLTQEQLCLTEHSTLECNDATKQKQEVHHNTVKNEKSANCISCKANNGKEIIYEYDDDKSNHSNNNDETFEIKEFMHTCLSDALIDALLTSTVKQEGCFFTVPYNKVYWNSRLGHEHSLLVSEMSSHDVLFDVMAGVGPFAIPAALRGLTVFANDLNPFAAAYMQFNRTANHLHKSAMHVCNMDGREFMRTVLLTEFVKELKLYYRTMMMHKEKEKQDQQQISSRPSRQFHVVMNLPALAVTFLDVFAPHDEEEEEEEWGSNELRTLFREEEFCKLHITSNNNMEGNAKQNTENLENNNNQDIDRKLHDSTFDGKEQLIQWLQHKFIIHVYCFSSTEDVCADALRQVEQNIGYSLLTKECGETCKARLVRDVSPLKRMICVSFSLPRVFWERYF